MSGVTDTVQAKLRESRFQWSRHAHLLSPDEQSAYKAAGGGAAGRRAVLAIMAGSETELVLHKRAWIAVRMQLWGREDADGAIVAYKRLVGGDEGWERAPVPEPPGGYGGPEHVRWDRELRDAFAASHP